MKNITIDETHESSFTFIDLFSGAGGFSLGFLQEGFKDLLAIEIDDGAVQTYNLNFPNTPMMNGDIRDIHSLQIQSKLKSSPDVILASPPCEPFTSANTARHKDPFDRFFADPQGDLIFHAIRIIGDLSPSYFVIENVVPIMNGVGKELITTEFANAGFEKIYFNVINAEKHGCPSERTRVFISNIRLKLPTMREISTGEAIGNLPDSSYPNEFLNHFTLSFPKRVSDKIHRIKKGEAAVHFSGAVEEKKTWIKLDPRKVADTIMGKSRFIHPDEDRPLTVREHARLMSFPDSFIFTGKVDSAFNQVGEAVPPIISKHIASIVRKLL
ncbi:MAG: DNA cytosine methyltransferase [Candidatus Heimdallarchaeota archaeon]|nr:DNA cytosine methyltransferase [Candidatus Heimdallarchaeota archaeon]